MALLVAHAMGEIPHPQADGRIEVEIINRQSHHGDYVQIQAVDDGITLSDSSGNPPWVEAEEVNEA